MKFIINYRLVILSLISMILLSCDKDLEIKTNFPFELEIMPTSRYLVKGIGIMQCKIKTEGNYKSTKYFIRYFQYEGLGKLGLPKKEPMRPNTLYPLEEKSFDLQYTSSSGEKHELTIWIVDNFGNEQTASFSFDSK